MRQDGRAVLGTNIAVRIPVEGAPAPLDLAGSVPSLAELQAAVGGFIETVAIPDEPMLVLIVDEDGRPRNRPGNPAASIIAGQRIVGDVVLMRRKALR